MNKKMPRGCCMLRKGRGNLFENQFISIIVKKIHHCLCTSNNNKNENGQSGS